MAVMAVVDAHTAKQNSDSTFRGSIINMSFTVDVLYASLFNALNRAAAARIVSVAAAGNDGEATLKWPCDFASVVCVGASDNNYNLW